MRNKMSRITIQCTPTFHENLKLFLKERKMNMSSFIRDAIVAKMCIIQTQESVLDRAKAEKSL